MPDGATARLLSTTGKRLPREQSSGGWGTIQTEKSHSFPLFIPLNEPWSFGAPKASTAAGGYQADSWGKESASTAQVD